MLDNKAKVEILKMVTEGKLGKDPCPMCKHWDSKKVECHQRVDMDCLRQREFEAERGVISCLIGDIDVVDAAYDMISYYDAIKEAQATYDLMWENVLRMPINGEAYEKENTEKDV